MELGKLIMFPIMSIMTTYLALLVFYGLVVVPIVLLFNIDTNKLVDDVGFANLMGFVEGVILVVSIIYWSRLFNKKVV